MGRNQQLDTISRFEAITFVLEMDPYEGINLETVDEIRFALWADVDDPITRTLSAEKVVVIDEDTAQVEFDCDEIDLLGSVNFEWRVDCVVVANGRVSIQTSPATGT